MQDVELWGGHECTVNRVGNRFFDQTCRSGHHRRPDDVELFASLGLSALRYPVLWERVAPDTPERREWRWSDERLSRIRALGVRPIVGLLHHGSGPIYTDLLDPAFPTLFADYARTAAERYPWARQWTPINEPLTTARFSALYGVWHPHLRDERAFWLALLNQIDATRLAMKAIRCVNPAAELIQTEDVGRTYGTAPVLRQAGFDNERRWASWDLLTGRLTPNHPLWDHLENFGLGDRLRRIADDPSPPDILGVNHYVTSDRFLDHRWRDYPADRHGGNQSIRFADVEAIRVLRPEPGGLAGALEETWARYRRPIAITEAHLACTREEQIRWLSAAWGSAHVVKEAGADIRAVTAWALLGSYDWDGLLTTDAGHYESGAFDVSGGAPRRTAVARAIAAIRRHGHDPHPAAGGLGWWRRDIRLTYAPAFSVAEPPAPKSSWAHPPPCPSPILIAGATGTLGRALARRCEWRGLSYVLCDRAQLCLDEEASIESALERHTPWAVINATGWVKVDEAEASASACMASNFHGAVRLASACAARGLRYTGFSSDLVFDGLSTTPYREGDETNPLNVYGLSKLKAEQDILLMHPGALMIRTAAFFSSSDPHDFAARLLSTIANGGTMAAASDLVVSPTYVPDLVDATLDLLIDEETGLWHLANGGAVSWFEFGRKIAKEAGADHEKVRPCSWRELGWSAPRPRFAALSSAKGRPLPALDDAVRRYADALQ